MDSHSAGAAFFTGNSRVFLRRSGARQMTRSRTVCMARGWLGRLHGQRASSRTSSIKRRRLQTMCIRDYCPNGVICAYCMRGELISEFWLPAALYETVMYVGSHRALSESVSRGQSRVPGQQTRPRPADLTSDRRGSSRS